MHLTDTDIDETSVVALFKVKDEKAPVDFFINGEQVVPDGENYDVKDLGEGKRQLIIKKAKMSDMGNVVAKTPSNKGDEVLESKSQFKVHFAVTKRPSFQVGRFTFHIRP